MENFSPISNDFGEFVTSSLVARVVREIQAWGTVIFVDAASSLVTNLELEHGINHVAEFVRHVDEVFSTYKPDSVISRLRRGDILIESTSPEVQDVWNRCLVARNLSEGAFDPWVVEGGFDPSGLVKGWAADICADILVADGAQHVQINAAGDLALRGGYFDSKIGEVKPWKIGVVNPDNRAEVLQIFDITNGAIATSGVYERGAHITDPYTGMIAIGAKSATIVGEKGWLCDALATAVMVAGTDAAIWFSSPNLKVIKSG